MLDIKHFTNPNELPGDSVHFFNTSLPCRYKNISRSYYLLYLDQQLIGWAQIFFHNNTEHEIEHLEIQPEHQGKGYGRKLLKFIIYNTSSSQLMLTTIRPDFFLKFGFKKMSSLPSFVDYTDKECQECQPEKCVALYYEKPDDLKKFGDCPMCQSRYLDLVEKSKPMINEYALTNNKMWSFVENPYFIDIDNTLFLVTYPFDHECYGVILPYHHISTSTLKKFINQMKAFQINKIKFSTSITLRRNPTLHEFTIQEDRDNFDYLYKISDFANFSGKKFEKKRNRLKKFIKNNKKYQIISYNKQHITDIIAFSKEISLKSLQISDIYGHNALEIGLKDNLLNGFFVKTEEKIAGLLLYSVLNPQTIVVHFELLDPCYDGLGAFMNHHLGQMLQGKYKFINREQDLGLPGLRQSKLSYRPYRLLKKYDILI